MKKTVFKRKWPKIAIIGFVFLLSLFIMGQVGAFWRDGLSVSGVVLPGAEQPVGGEVAVLGEITVQDSVYGEPEIILKDTNVPPAEEPLIIPGDSGISDVPAGADTSAVLAGEDTPAALTGEDIIVVRSEEVNSSLPEKPAESEVIDVTDLDSGGAEAGTESENAAAESDSSVSVSN